MIFFIIVTQGRLFKIRDFWPLYVRYIVMLILHILMIFVRPYMNVSVLVPTEARCTFESGFCGWRNTSGEMSLTWKLYKGDRHKFTGPKWDNTFRNRTGNMTIPALDVKRKSISTIFFLTFFYYTRCSWNAFGVFFPPQYIPFFCFISQVPTLTWTCPDRPISGRQRAWTAYISTHRRPTVPTLSRNITILVMWVSVTFRSLFYYIEVENCFQFGDSYYWE